jgi:hypothetical protein
MKECSGCGLLKESSHFYKRKDRACGVISRCIDCTKTLLKTPEYLEKRRIINKKKLPRRKRESNDWSNTLKTGPCTDCGIEYPPYVMDWDHMPGETKFKGVSSMVSCLYSKERVLSEISKCELVCSNCHRIRTHSRRKRKFV